MKNLVNIEKLGGRYVGYACGTVWRIARTSSGWRATARDKCVPGYMERRTLAEISDALTAWDNAGRDAHIESAYGDAP